MEEPIAQAWPACAIDGPAPVAGSSPLGRSRRAFALRLVHDQIEPGLDGRAVQVDVL